jgi:hypothetical protein
MSQPAAPAARRWHRAKRAVSPSQIERREHRLVNLRLLGWTLIGAWQLLSLASEFVSIDLNSDAMRITGKVLGLVGLMMVAIGFERLFALKHPGRRRFSRSRT